MLPQQEEEIEFSMKLRFTVLSKNTEPSNPNLLEDLRRPRSEIGEHEPPLQSWHTQKCK